MIRALVIWLVIGATIVAQAAPHQVLVLRAEGNADSTSRASVDAQVLRLAKNIDGKVDAGDITLTDAAAAAGCAVAEASCRDEILMTFAVDEIVTATVTAAGGGQLGVTVRRLTRGAPPKIGQATIPVGKNPVGRLDAEVGPLFGLAPVNIPVEKTVPAKQPEPTPAPTPTPRAPVTPPPSAAPAPVDPYATATQPASTPLPPTTPVPESAPPNRRWQKIGMAAGAGLVVLGFLMWSAASSKQDEIDAAPVNTPADFANLQQLERDADGLAGGGNLFFLGGLVLGGVSGYFYWKKGRQGRAQTARITPTVFPNGGGLVLTFGGGR